MKISLSAPRSLLLAGAFFSAFTFGAAAQQPATPAAGAAPAAAPALPPGSPLIGRPDGDAAAKLAPVAGPPLATAADKLPTAKLKVPAGFNIEVYAAGMANARSLAQSDKGTVFVGSRLVDKVYAITNKDGKREVKVRVEGQLVFSTAGLILNAAVAGFGLAYLPEDQVRAQLADERLVRVLTDWCPPFAGYHLYYPSRRQPSAAFALLVDALRHRA